MTARALYLLPLLAACYTEWTPPETVVRFTPPPEYGEWWNASRACIQRPEYRAFYEIEWYLSADILTGADGDPHGAMVARNRVYIWQAYADKPWVIQHELVHAINLLGNDHPADPFERCGLMRAPEVTQGDLGEPLS